MSLVSLLSSGSRAQAVDIPGVLEVLPRANAKRTEGCRIDATDMNKALSDPAASN